MKSRFEVNILVMILILIMAVPISNQVIGQTTLGILPVNTSAVSASVLNARQWQGISSQMCDLFVMQLAGVGKISKLSREHIMLLLKEVPVPDPENLDAEAYKIISKKENLHYLLKCSIESIYVADKNVLAPIRVSMVDGNNGQVYWEKVMKTSRIVSNQLIAEQIIDISRELTSLKY
jgi:hypothetical protein